MAGRIAGVIEFKADGVQYRAKGSWSFGYGKPVREAISGADGVHGFKESSPVPYLEGAITDDGTINIDTLAGLTDTTFILSLANGKIFLLRNGWSVNPDGLVGTTEESEIAVRFEGLSAEDVR